MRKLYKKISAGLLAAMMVSGGFIASGVSVHANSLGNGLNGKIEPGGYLRRGVESAIYSYQQAGKGKSKIYLEGYYSDNNKDFQGVPWYKFNVFIDIHDFLDWAEKNNMKGMYKVFLEKEDAIIVFSSR